MAGQQTAAARTVALEHGDRRVVVMDSISFASDDDAGQIVVTGSHCGASAGEYARRVRVACVVGNDAGFGKNDAGITGLRDVDADGILGIAVGHDSARIGDGRDVWVNGVITFVNEAARRAGFVPGHRVEDETRAFLRRTGEPRGGAPC